MVGNSEASNSRGAVGEDEKTTKTLGHAVTQREHAKASLAELTAAEVRTLARNEIEKWHAERPKLFRPRTWGRRTQAGAVAGVMFTTGATLLGFVDIDHKTITAPIHSAVGTNAHVEDALRTYAEAGATDENPIFGLIGETMRQAPVLAFHGEQTFGRSFELELPDRECQQRRFEEAKSLSSEEYEALPLPEGEHVEALEDVENLCAIRGLIDFGLDLDIPFHARFFEKGNGALPHQAWLVAFIRRTSADDDSTLLDQVDAEGRPPGLCFLYKPASPAPGIESLAITDLEQTGNGFWSANLTESLIAARVWDGTPINPDATTSLHSIVIEGVMEEEGRPDPSSECLDVTTVEGQIISVSAMILVNKNAHE